MTKRSRIFTIIIVLVLTIMFGVQLYIIWGLTIPLSKGQQEDRLRAAELQQRIADLEYMLDNTDDPDVIRRIAEELLGLVSPDEIIISSGTDGRGSD
ncbi:MAG: septum formation initiator family protein [Oscillospiraceae bacterium]|nr:septum formation initiator family protein [Oscillospiraceae bacterium]